MSDTAAPQMTPPPSALPTMMQTIFEELHGETGGAVADYIPQLADVNPALFGIAFCDTRGQIHSVGDATNDFCLQSCSKPFNYCLARTLHDADPDRVPDVHEHVGYEPSGRAFNEFALTTGDGAGHGLPHNPLINAGAIMVASLIESAAEPSKRFATVQQFYTRLAGNVSKVFDNGVFLSEKHHADRNMSSYYMGKQGVCRRTDARQLHDHLELYYRVAP